MMHSRPLSPLQLLTSTPDVWVEGDIVYPAQSQRLNGHVTGGNGGVSPYPDEPWMPDVSQDGQTYYLNGQRGECLHCLPHFQAGEDLSPAYADPLSATNSAASEGILHALEGISDHLAPRHGTQTAEPWTRTANTSTVPHRFMSPLDRQMSWDFIDTEAPPPYTPEQPEASFSPLTPSLSSGSLSALDTPMSPSLIIPSSSTLPIRIRSLSSSGLLNAATAQSVNTSPPHRKRSVSSAGLAKKSSTGQTRPSRQLPALPARLALVSPAPSEEAESLVQASLPSSQQQESPVALFGRIRKAIAVLSDHISSVEPMGHLKYEKVNEHVTNIVDAVRVLLFVTATPADDVSYDGMPDHLDQAVFRRHLPERLRTSYRMVTGTLSNLVTATVGLQIDPALSATDSRLEATAADLERSIRDFVKEIQRALQDGHRLSSTSSTSSVKAYHGSFIPPETGLGLPGAGSAGSWKGLGYAQSSERSNLPLQILDASVISQLNVLVGPIERKLLGLVASSSSVHSKSDRLQSEGQCIAGHLSSLLELLGDIDISRHDYTPSDTDGSDYADVMERKHLIRTVEAAMQALYDDSAVFFMTVQTSGSLEALASSTSRSNPIGGLVTAIMANLSLTISTLKSLVAISREQVDPAHLTLPETSAFPRRTLIMSAGRGSVSTQSTSSDQRDDEKIEDVVDMELAFFQRPPIKVNTSLDSNEKRRPSVTGPTQHRPNLSSTSSLDASTGDRLAAPSPFRPVTPSRPRHGSSLSTATIDSDTSWTSVSAEADASVNKSPQRATKLFQILGRDAPRHYIDSMNTDSKPWYLRPTYVQSEIRIEPNGDVTAGTTTALVERLTAHDHGDPVFSKDFLMTFKSFMTVNELFDMLVQRFWIQPPEGMNERELKEWTSLKQHVVRTRVLNTLISMISDEDILEKEDMHILETMKEFVTNREVMESPAAKQTAALIERLQRGSKAKVKTLNVAAVAPPSPIVPRTRELKVLDIDPLEMARQLTLMESALHKKIRPSECLQRTREPTPDRNKDSIAAVIRLNTKLINWVVETILSRPDARKRAQMMKHFINVADRCRGLQNFSSMFAIVSALNKPEIRRLTRSWDQVSQRNFSLFTNCDTLLDPNKNFHNYWSALGNITPPCIPFFGRYLSTLTFINDGAKDNLSQGQMINFRKRQKAAGVIRDIKRWQSRPYNFQTVAVILAFLEEALNKYADGVDYSNQWWHLSLEREPRERADDGEKLNRLLQQSGL